MDVAELKGSLRDFKGLQPWAKAGFREILALWFPAGHARLYRDSFLGFSNLATYIIYIYIYIYIYTYIFILF